MSSCSSSETTSLVALPNFDFECTSSQASDCSATANNKPFRLGLSFSSSFDCRTGLQSAGSDLKEIFTLSSTATSEFTGLLMRGSALSSTWVNSSNESITQVGSGTYTLCAHLDTNENSLLDSSEPISSRVLDISFPDQLSDSWEEF